MGSLRLLRALALAETRYYSRHETAADLRARIVSHRQWMRRDS